MGMPSNIEHRAETLALLTPEQVAEAKRLCDLVRLHTGLHGLTSLVYSPHKRSILQWMMNAWNLVMVEHSKRYEDCPSCRIRLFEAVQERIKAYESAYPTALGTPA